MQPSFIIRPATPEDGEGIAALFMRVWGVTLKPFLPDGFLSRFEHDVQKQKYAERAADPGWTLFVAEGGGRIVGMIGAKDNDAEPFTYQKQVKAMYVDPDAQGRGVGTALLEVLFETLRNGGVKSAMLWCIAGNARARGFYEKRGGRGIAGVAAPQEYDALPHVAYGWDL